MSNEKDMPHLTKDGMIRASPGTGIPKEYKVMKYTPLDSEELERRGIVPEGGLRWDDEYLKTIRYRKFGPEQRAVFLEKLAETGRIKIAAIHAGVLPSCVERHRKEDPSLEEETQLALTMYHEQTVALIAAQARAGMHDIRYDKEGKVVARRVSYEQQLRIRLLERADSDYKQVQKSEVSVTGGTAVIPAPIDSLESWDDIVRKHVGGGTEARALPNPESGPAALGDGRVVRRPVSGEPIDTTGETSESTDQTE
jgi:hypothetical protein